MKNLNISSHRGFDRAMLIVALTVAAYGGSGSAAAEPSAADKPQATTMIFQQPTLTGIADNWYVANVSTGGLPQGVFTLVAWNPNIHDKSGEYVASTWDAAADTGFTPSNLSEAQLSMQNKTGSTTAQIEGNIVGAYINAKDLKAPAVNQQMMISPQYIFPVGQQPKIYTGTTSVLSSSMQLQIPVASGGDTFASVDLLFVDPNGVRLSFAVKLFDYGHLPNQLGTNFDTATDTFLFNCPLGGEPDYITQSPGSANGTGTPWVGWQTFAWSISESQFAAAIKYMQTQYPGQIPTTNPRKWVLDEIHLNAQFTVLETPTVLGWSMSGWQVSVTD